MVGFIRKQVTYHKNQTEFAIDYLYFRLASAFR